MFLARIWVRVRKIIAWKEGKAVETVIDGLKIRYIDQGSGTPVLLLHGWGVEASVYHLIIDHLSARYRVVLRTFQDSAVLRSRTGPGIPPILRPLWKNLPRRFR